MKALSSLLVQPAIIPHFTANTAEEVVIALGKLLESAGYVKSTFVQAALTREHSMPTGLPLMGDANAAIPHTDIEHVLKPGVALATLSEPVIFQNMANPKNTVEVKIVFLLALDQPKAQVEMLQEIAGVLQNPDLIDKLIKANKAEEIVRILQDHI